MKQLSYDEIPKLPELDEEIKIEVDYSTMLEELPFAKHCFILYENEKGETRVYFNRLDHFMYANVVTNFSKPDYFPLFEFWKLAIEGTRLIRQEKRKGLEMAGKIE